MFQTIKDNGFGDTVPIAGLFSAGAFTNKLFASSPNRGTAVARTKRIRFYIYIKLIRFGSGVHSRPAN